MSKSIFLAVSALIILNSCSEKPNDLTYINSELVAANLIQICIDSTLQLDDGLNSDTYSVDFSKAKDLNSDGVRRFLLTHPSTAQTNLDSLFQHIPKKNKYNFFFKQPIIRFEKIEKQNNGTILINTSKIRAAEGAIGTRIILKKHGNKFKCMLSEITWIS